MRSVVVFPQPDGPSRVMKCPSGTSSETLSTATVAPSRFVTPFRRTWSSEDIVVFVEVNPHVEQERRAGAEGATGVHLHLIEARRARGVDAAGRGHLHEVGRLEPGAVDGETAPGLRESDEAE